MRYLSRIAVVAAVCSHATSAFAQATAADGVQAIVRGDYTSALRILKPLAEDPAHADGIAQFFLAALYDSGLGVARNPMRACGLYAAAADAPTAFAPLAREIADAMLDPARMANRMLGCPPADTHPWGDPPPTTFTLGDGHSFHVDANGTTITFQGASHHAFTTTGGAGLVYLPLRYTRLDVTSPAPARRHFIEWFVWHRDNPADLDTWSLAWMLQEVVGAELRTPAHHPSLMTSRAARPPTAVDLAHAVVLRVNAEGVAEWAAPDPVAPRGGVIPDGPR